MAYLAALVVVWVIVALRLPVSIRIPRHRPITATLALPALAATLRSPPLGSSLDGFIGVPNATQVLAHCLIILAGAALHSVITTLVVGGDNRQRRGGRSHYLLATISIAAMIVLFAASPASTIASNNLTRDFVRDPWMLAYWAVFLANLGRSLAAVTALSWRHAAHTPRRGLRANLLLYGGGCAAGFVYCVHKAGVLALAAAGTVDIISRTAPAVAKELIALALLMIAAATIIPLAARGLAIIRARRAILKLRPLWLALQAATPTIVLDTSAAPEGTAPSTTELRLYRMIIEIRDGILAIRPYLNHHDRARVRTLCARQGHDGAKGDPAAAACLLELARRAKFEGRAPGPDTASEHAGGRDVHDETRELIRLARAWRHPSTHMLADTVERARSTGGTATGAIT